MTIRYNCHLCGAYVYIADKRKLNISENARVALNRMAAKEQCLNCEIKPFEELAAIELEGIEKL